MFGSLRQEGDQTIPEQPLTQMSPCFWQSMWLESACMISKIHTCGRSGLLSCCINFQIDCQGSLSLLTAQFKASTWIIKICNNHNIGRITQRAERHLRSDFLCLKARMDLFRLMTLSHAGQSKDSEGNTIFHPIAQYKDAEILPEIRVYRLDTNIFFASVEDLHDELIDRTDELLVGQGQFQLLPWSREISKIPLEPNKLLPKYTHIFSIYTRGISDAADQVESLSQWETLHLCSLKCVVCVL